MGQFARLTLGTGDAALADRELATLNIPPTDSRRVVLRLLDPVRWGPHETEKWRAVLDRHGITPVAVDVASRNAEHLAIMLGIPVISAPSATPESSAVPTPKAVPPPPRQAAAVPRTAASATPPATSSPLSSSSVPRTAGPATPARPPLSNPAPPVARPPVTPPAPPAAAVKPPATPPTAPRASASPPAPAPAPQSPTATVRPSTPMAASRPVPPASVGLASLASPPAPDKLTKPSEGVAPPEMPSLPTSTRRAAPATDATELVPAVSDVTSQKVTEDTGLALDWSEWSMFAAMPAKYVIHCRVSSNRTAAASTPQDRGSAAPTTMTPTAPSPIRAADAPTLPVSKESPPVATPRQDTTTTATATPQSPSTALSPKESAALQSDALSIAVIHSGGLRTGARLTHVETIIVEGDVASAADVVSSGSIRVDGILRGRAIAGEGGNPKAIVTCAACEAELVSIAGVFLTGDMIDPGLRGKPLQFSLEANGQRIRIRHLPMA